MSMNFRNQFKKGAASFYIVAFATLILLIVATSFAAIIISEITRTSNDDLSQSAYDSAMAGVEDAKLAYYNYQNCVNSKSGGDCSAIIDIVENPGSRTCDMVKEILQRTNEGKIEVDIKESNTMENNMQQAYTCVKLKTVLSGYESTMSSSDSFRVIDVKFDGDSTINNVSQMRVSWYHKSDNRDLNFNNVDDKGVIFGTTAGSGAKAAAIPPTISVAVLQTGLEFNLSDFEKTANNTTNKGMVYLVPTDDEKKGSNRISVGDLVKSNDKTATNAPHMVYCHEPNDGGYACEVTIDLPRPVGGGDRNPNTFKVITALPYGEPSTDFYVEFLCSGNNCGTAADSEDGEVENKEIAYLNGVQIEIDSTGRANDLYRRVVTRLDRAGGSNLSIMGPLELLGTDDGGKTLLEKMYSVTTEYNF